MRARRIHAARSVDAMMRHDSVMRAT